jgi:hypothetical protein
MRIGAALACFPRFSIHLLLFSIATYCKLHLKLTPEALKA